jgi:hypothetical protein
VESIRALPACAPRSTCKISLAALSKKPRTVVLLFSEAVGAQKNVNSRSLARNLAPLLSTDPGYFQQEHKNITLLRRGALHYRRTRGKRRTFAGDVDETFSTNQTSKDSNRDFSNSICISWEWHSAQSLTPVLCRIRAELRLLPR